MRTGVWGERAFHFALLEGTLERCLVVAYVRGLRGELMAGTGKRWHLPPWEDFLRNRR